MSFLSDWNSLNNTQHRLAIKGFCRGGWPPQTDYIKLVVSDHHGGVYASTGTHYIDAIFGRDSLETAEDLLATHQPLVKNILLGLARLQGVKTNHTSEEEPGKIHHEYRTSKTNDGPLSQQSLEILRKLQQIWGGVGTDQMIYYGSHDATLLYVRLIADYVKRYGREILSEGYVGRDGQSQTIEQSALSATHWIVSKIDQASAKLFIYRRLNPTGLANQSWKDSITGFMHTDGRWANFDGGIAATGLQGLTYDALKAANYLGLGSTEDQQQWLKLAVQLQTETIKQLWMPDQAYFAQGLDLDSHNQAHQIATLTSDPGVLLSTALLHDLPKEQAEPYIEGIVQMLCSAEFLTPVGVRCRALRHWRLPGFIDYHGTNSVWPKETFDISKGFRRAGFNRLADALDECTINSLETAGEFYEFFYVSRDGVVWYDHRAAIKHFGSESPGQSLPIPESGQAWTIAAAERIIYNRSQPQAETAVSDFEKKLLDTIPLLTAD